MTNFIMRSKNRFLCLLDFMENEHYNLVEIYSKFSKSKDKFKKKQAIRFHA
jgi:hypothetical protein